MSGSPTDSGSWRRTAEPTAIPFYSRCPVGQPKCTDGMAKHYWEHTNCGGKMYIDDEAYMFCDKRKNTHRFHVKDWKFKCHTHLDYHEADTQVFLESIGNMVESLEGLGWSETKAGGWIRRCIYNLTKPHTSNNSCVICCSENSEVVVIPCYHVCMCLGCSGLVSKCPVCDGRIAVTKKIFLC
ncbi:hypothetical protein Pelo_14840 [Pelomyxa schiedti]|nr:hypothetical protein Pelo_14840 [Pelomyxa schiedti]